MEQQGDKQNKVLEYLKNISRKDKLILTFTVVLVSITVALKFVILPQLDKYITGLNELDKVRAEQIRLSVITNENQILTEEAEKLAIKYENALNELPKTKAIARVIYDLKGLINKNNIDISAMNFSEGDVSENEFVFDNEELIDENGVITEVERGIEWEMEEGDLESFGLIRKQIINITLLGEYKNIISFIKDIESYSRIAEVSNITISKAEGKSLSVSLTANFYNLNYKEKEQYDFNNGKYGREDSFN